MTEKDLGKALLRLDSMELAGVPDVRQQTWRIVERDRRRVRLLAGVTIGVWLLALVLVLLVLVSLGLLFPLQARLKQEKAAGKMPAAEVERLQEETEIGFKMQTVLTALSVGVLAVAAFCTVLLIASSRRATLRQVNANLLEISEQLKQLRQAQAK
jgi:hypothetical protein